MKDKKKIIIFNLLIILLTSFFTGCTENIVIPIISPGPSSNPNELINSKITIENGAETTKDCTPVLTISFEGEGADYMSFSGDGNNWTDWLPYNPSYEEFNIANGLNGTIFGSGIKDVYIRFKDLEGNTFPADVNILDSIQYEMQDLHFLKIIPRNVTVSVGEDTLFTLHAYDLGGINEVPVEGSKITWTKCCGVGKLNPTTGLSTTYTAPLSLGERDISAHYNNLGAGAEPGQLFWL
jgi:hypothetical protein